MLNNNPFDEFRYPKRDGCLLSVIIVVTWVIIIGGAIIINNLIF